MRIHHCDVTTDGERANGSITCIESSIRQSEGIERESIGLSSKLYSSIIVLNPLVGYGGATEVVGYKHPTLECVVALSQHCSPPGNDPGSTNWEKEKMTMAGIEMLTWQDVCNTHMQY